jgi:hypothetical protein
MQPADGNPTLRRVAYKTAKRPQRVDNTPPTVFA